MKKGTALQRIVWTKAMLSHLGNDYDTAVARKLGLSLTLVKRKRILRGIPARGRSKPLPASLLRRLGKETDHHLATLYRVPKTAITDERNRRHIPPAVQPKLIRVRWTTDMDQLLGVHADTVLAKRFDCGQSTVSRRRHFLAIPAKKPLFWTRTMLAALGKESDLNLAQRWGIHQYTISLKRRSLGIPRWHALRHAWTATRIKALGTKPDADLGRQWGIGRSSVAAKRRSLRIRLPRPKLQPPPGEESFLGKEHDIILAKRWGLSALTIMRMRHERGIARAPTATQPLSSEAHLLKKKSAKFLSQRWGISRSTVRRMQLRHRP